MTQLINEAQVSPFEPDFFLRTNLENPARLISVTVAIPAYNEERFIGSVVIQALRVTPNVIVIDDGSKDATAYIAEMAGAQVLRHQGNKGKSEALNTALDWSRQRGIQALVFIDGDGQHRPSEIESVLEPILQGQADMVVGSRFLEVKSKIPLYRKFGQHALTTATNIASSVSVTDSQSGFRAFSHKAIELLHFAGTGFSVESEMQFLAKEHSLKVAEVPISVVYQEKAKRNPFAHGMQIISNMAKLVGQHRPLFFFGLPGLICLLVGVGIGLVTTDIYSRSGALAMGYALLSVLMILLGILAVFVGMILHSVKAFFLDLKKSVQRSVKVEIKTSENVKLPLIASSSEITLRN